MTTTTDVYEIAISPDNCPGCIATAAGVLHRVLSVRCEGRPVELSTLTGQHAKDFLTTYADHLPADRAAEVLSTCMVAMDSPAAVLVIGHVSVSEAPC